MPVVDPDLESASFIEPTETVRAAAREAVLQELEAIGSRRKQLLSDAEDDLERLAAFLPVAVAAGIRQNEIAERAAVSRQTLVNLRNEGRGLGQEWSIDLEAMLVLAFQGPQTVESLTSSMPVAMGDAETIDAVLTRLIDIDAAAWAGATMSGEHRHDYFKLTSRGVEELPARLRSAVIPENKRWTAYVAADQAEVDKLAEIGQSILGEARVGVIPAGTMKTMRRPEVAFEVEAPSFAEATYRAAEFYSQLREHARLAPEPADVTALVPPGARTRTRALARDERAASVEAGFEHLRADVGAELQASPSVKRGNADDLLDLARRAPSAAIVEGHMRIETELRDALAATGDRPPQSDGAGALVREAHDRGLITSESLNAVDGAIVMRNLAIHGPRRDISVWQAEEFVSVAEGVLYAIRQNVKSFKRRRPS
jgi:hypothetical protein